MKHLAFMLLVLVAFVGRGASQTAWTTPTAAEVDAVYPDIESLYIDLHQNPELAFQEVRTAAKLAARVKALGYEVTTGVGRTGIVAVMRNGLGPTVMLRTELDALPVEEKTDLPFASKVVVKSATGGATAVMHACGHDIHMSAWTGTARLMAEHRDRWHGTLVLVGQPAEESGSGASAMLKDGLFTRFPRPDFALSLHDDDTMPALSGPKRLSRKGASQETFRFYAGRCRMIRMPNISRQCHGGDIDSFRRFPRLPRRAFLPRDLLRSFRLRTFLAIPPKIFSRME